MGGGGAAAAPAIIPPSFARVSDVTRTPKTTGGGGGAVKCSPAPMIASMATPRLACPGARPSPKPWRGRAAMRLVRLRRGEFRRRGVDRQGGERPGRESEGDQVRARRWRRSCSSRNRYPDGRSRRAWCAKSVRGRTAVSARGDGWIRGSGRRWPRWVGRCDGSVEDTERTGAEEGGEPRCLLPVCQRNAASASVKSHARDTALRKSVPTGDKTRSLAQRLVTSWRWRWRREWTRCSAAETSTRSRVTSTRSSWRRALRRIGPGRARPRLPRGAGKSGPRAICVPARARGCEGGGFRVGRRARGAPVRVAA